MDPKVKLCLLALLTLCCSCLTLLHPLWLTGVLISLFLLWHASMTALLRSETDPLTGLWNLRHLEQMRRRYGRCANIAVIYLDLDDLKQINDVHGHAAGDIALQEVACTLLDADDDTYRIGGDEFLLISKDMNAAQLRSCWCDASESLSVRVSWGIAEGAGSQLDSLIAQAEQDMYNKKRSAVS